MNGGDEVARRVEQILRQRGITGNMDRALPLGAEGLALDSIAIAELLLTCEEHFGVVFAADALAGEPLTIARLIEHVQVALPG
jgi:acyl carrier protein